MAIWTPDTFWHRVATLPDGDLRHASGLRLRRRERWEPSPYSQGARYSGPQELAVIASLDDTPQHGVLLHASLSYRDRDPDWATIRAVRDLFYPVDVDVAMILPREEDYVAVHPHCFHLWETPTAWGLR